MSTMSSDGTANSYSASSSRRTTPSPRQTKLISEASPPSGTRISPQKQQMIVKMPPTTGRLPSSVLANQSQNVPATECCCFSARFVNLVLFLFNFLFLLSGICILLLTCLYGRPEVSRYLGETTKYLVNIINLLGNGHLVKIIHYSMLFCGIIIVTISFLNIIFSTITSWSKNSDYYYYRRRRRRHSIASSIYNQQNQFTFDSSIERRKSTSYLNDESMILNQSDDLIQNNRNNQSTSSTSSESTSSIARNSSRNNQLINRDENGRIIRKSDGTEYVKCHLKRRRRHHSSLSHFANSTVVLCCYIFILLFLFTIQLVIGLISIISVSPNDVFLFSNHNAHKDDFLISVRDSVLIDDLLVNHSDEIEALYQPFKCCGWTFFDDYELTQNSTSRNESIPVPDTCCKTIMPNCGRRKHPNNIYFDGCWSKFGTEMREYVLMLGWTALGFAVIELIGLLFAVCHYVQIMSKI